MTRGNEGEKNQEISRGNDSFIRLVAHPDTGTDPPQNSGSGNRTQGDSRLGELILIVTGDIYLLDQQRC